MAFELTPASFQWTTTQYIDFLDRSGKALDALPPVTGPRVVFPIFNWLLTSVPYYSMTLALMYRMKGYQPVLLWANFEGGTTPAEVEEAVVQNREIAAVVDIMRKWMIVVEAGPLEPLPLNDLETADIRSMSLSLAISRIRTSVPNPITTARVEAYRALMSDRLGRLKRAQDIIGPVDHLVTPGGFNAESGLIMRLFARSGARTASYDCGLSLALADARGPAAHRRDVVRAFDEIVSLQAGTPPYQSALDSALELWNSLAKKQDAYQLQKVSIESEAITPEADILILMNEEYDAAVLGQHVFFDHSCDWATSTTQWLLENTSARIALRQHPGARIWGAPEYLYSAAYFDAIAAASDGRVTFFSADAEVNSYSLIQHAKVVLVEASTIGMEAAAMGKPVIIESGVFYRDLPFVQGESSRDGYFRAIADCLAAPWEPTQLEREQAWLCYFLAQICNALPTNFTPQPDDYLIWSQADLTTLSGQEEVEMIIECMIHDRPVASMQMHKRLFGAWR